MNDKRASQEEGERGELEVGAGYFKSDALTLKLVFAVSVVGRLFKNPSVLLQKTLIKSHVSVAQPYTFT